jgi:hypothetical protein
MKVIGYIHICQKGNWMKSFDMIWNAITKYGLYDKSEEIRCGIVNDDGILMEDERLKDKKIKIVHVGKSEEYERATLHDMAKQSDNEDVLYYYLHTKGLKYWGTYREKNVERWIDMMLYFNIEHWNKCYDTLLTNKWDVYGVDYWDGNNHKEIDAESFDGNFWWATSSYIRRLDKTIGPRYGDTEHWIMTKDDVRIFSVFQSPLVGWAYKYHFLLDEGFKIYF